MTTETIELTQPKQPRAVASLIFAGLFVASAVVVVLVLLLTSPWSGTKAEDVESAPAVVEPIEGTELSTITLSPEAAERLGIETAEATDNTIPYSALLYDLNGGAYVYTSPEPLTFVRASITVDHIDGAVVVLLDGPSDGTEVVTVGAAELFGAEFEFEEE